VSAQSSSAANPFAGIPPISSLPVCNTECAAVGQAQSSWNGDYSAFCTTSFVNSLTTCLSCILNSSIGALINTPEDQQVLSQAITAYQNACQQSGSPITINISSILSSPTSSVGGSGAASSPALTSTQTSTTSTPSTTGAATRVEFGAGAMFGAVAFVAGSLF